MVEVVGGGERFEFGVVFDVFGDARIVTALGMLVWEEVGALIGWMGEFGIYLLG